MKGFFQSSISSMSFMDKCCIAKNSFLYSTGKQPYFCYFTSHLFHTSWLMKVHLKGCIKIKPSKKLEFIWYDLFLTNSCWLLLTIIIPFMSGLLYCYGVLWVIFMKVIQFFLSCSQQEALGRFPFCWATQVSLSQLYRCLGGRVDNKIEQGLHKCDSHHVSEISKGKIASWVGQQSLAQNPYNLTV